MNTKDTRAAPWAHVRGLVLRNSFPCALQGSFWHWRSASSCCTARLIILHEAVGCGSRFASFLSSPYFLGSLKQSFWIISVYLEMWTQAETGAETPFPGPKEGAAGEGGLRFCIKRLCVCWLVAPGWWSRRRQERRRYWWKFGRAHTTGCKD